MPKFYQYAHQAIDTAYKMFAHDCCYDAPGGGVHTRGQLGIFEIRDVEENLEGATIETDIRNYAVRFRNYLWPKHIPIQVGGIITLPNNDDFDGHTRFHIDETPRKYGRGGHQIILSVTPQIAPEKTAHPGYNFGDGDD